MDQGIAVILGVLLGAGLSSARAGYEWYAKRRRFEIAIGLELRRAVRMIDEKMSWLQRSLPAEIIEAVADRVVEIDGCNLYLGEDEQFTIPLPFWQANYREVVSLLPTRSFSAFAAEIELVEMFQSKFCDMKLSFSGSVGAPQKMAAACYKDLLAIHQRLNRARAPH